MFISVLTAIVVAAAADRARNETYCGRAGRGSFRCRTYRTARPMTVASDAHYFVGGMGISTFDRGVVDMRSTRDQYRAAPATPANCTFMVRRHRGQEPSLRHFTSFP